MHRRLDPHRIAAAITGETVEPSPPDLPGYSGDRLVAMLARLAQVFAADPAACYLEIGVFQGKTLLSVAHCAPDIACFGIDNFAFFDAEGRNRGLIEERRQAIQVGNATLIDRDYEEALGDLGAQLDGRKIGVYFIDGPHDYRSQLMCLLLAEPHLHQQAVIVVDDANYLHVRQANADFLSVRPDYRLAFEAYTPAHPGNMDPAAHAAARRGYWNGVNVITRGLPVTGRPLPPTPRDRTLFTQQHEVMAHRLAPMAMRCLNLCHRLQRLKRSLVTLGGLVPRRTAAPGIADLPPARYRAMNTYSGDLPEACSHLNEAAATTPEPSSSSP